MPADTIYALATGAGRSAIAVIRISGPHTRDAIALIAGVAPRPREAKLVRFRDPMSGEIVDQGLIVWFPGPKIRDWRRLCGISNSRRTSRH